MTEETTTEQLAEIEEQAEDTPATEYTPPEGWRVLQSGELLQPGDHWVNWEGTVSRPDIQHGDGATVSGGRYIRWVKPSPQPEPHAAAIEELRSEVSYVQRLLGTERRRVAELEELASSLRTINVAQEKAFTAAGKENTALRNQLAAVKAELASVAADRYRLQIELDAAQQVPADSPELRQLRADLEQATLGRDTYRDGYDRVLSDLVTARKTAKAEAVEAIAEWLEPVRAAIAAADNVAESTRAGWLAEAVIQHLPSIMRSLVGLDSPEDVD